MNKWQPNRAAMFETGEVFILLQYGFIHKEQVEPLLSVYFEFAGHDMFCLRADNPKSRPDIPYEREKLIELKHAAARLLAFERYRKTSKEDAMSQQDAL